MEAKSVTGMIMGLFVAITVVAVILVPTINEASAEEVVFTNDGLCYMEKYGEDAEFTAVWSYTDPDALTVDGESIAIPTSGDQYTFLLGNDGLTIYYSEDRIGAYNSTSKLIGAEVSDSQNFTITAANGSLTLTNGTDTVDVPITGEFYFAAKAGDYVLKDVTDTAYVSGSDSVFYIATTNAAPSPITSRYMIEGTVDDGFSVTNFGSNYGLSTDNHQILATAVDGYDGIYTFTGVTFDITVTVSNHDYNGTITEKQFVVPYKIVYSEQGSLHNFGSMLSVLPLIVIAAIVLSSVALVATRRD